jgi:hypothetical protein
VIKISGNFLQPKVGLRPFFKGYYAINPQRISRIRYKLLGAQIFLQLIFLNPDIVKSHDKENKTGIL